MRLVTYQRLSEVSNHYIPRKYCLEKKSHSHRMHSRRRARNHSWSGRDARRRVSAAFRAQPAAAVDPLRHTDTEDIAWSMCRGQPGGRRCGATVVVEESAC